MPDPKVTVLMSVYNGERFLREAIDAILHQTCRDFEFLIVNDGSTDTSREIILSYHDPRIRLIDNEENIGLTRSLNKGLEQSRGTYIARADADDISLPERLEKQVDYLEKNPEVVLLGSWEKVIDQEGKIIRRITRFPTEHCHIAWSLLTTNCIPHSAAMFRRDKAREAGNYDNSIAVGQDYDLWVRLSQTGKLKQLPEILLLFRKSVSGSVTDKHFQAQRKIKIQVGLNYTRSIYPEIDYQNFIHLSNRTKSSDLTYGQIKEIVSLAQAVNHRFFQKYNPDLSCKKRIIRDTKRWFLRWAKNNWSRPLVCFYLIKSGIYDAKGETTFQELE